MDNREEHKAKEKTTHFLFSSLFHTIRKVWERKVIELSNDVLSLNILHVVNV